MFDRADRGLRDERLDLAGDDPRGLADAAEVEGADPVGEDQIAPFGQALLEQVQRPARGHVTVQ